MKTIAAFAGLVFAASLAQAQVSPTAKPAAGVDKGNGVVTAETRAVTVSTDPKAVPAKPAPAKKDAKKVVPKEAPLPAIPGTVIIRANGTKLGLEVVGGNFKLSFYDKKHKLMPVDVTRAAARWPNPRSPGDNRTILNGSGTALIGAKPVLPPYVFNVYLTLLQGEGDQAVAVESYTVQFRG